jgi:hypothetical protein
MLHIPTMLRIPIAGSSDLHVNGNYCRRLSHCVQPAYIPDISVSHPDSGHAFAWLSLNTRRDLHADICSYVCEQQCHRNAGGCGAQKDCRGTNEHTRSRLKRMHNVGEGGICKIATAGSPSSLSIDFGGSFVVQRRPEWCA